MKKEDKFEPKDWHKKFEVKKYFHENGEFSEGIFVDGELFDWSINEEDVQWARKQGPEYFAAVQKDIVKHFFECLSEMVGRPVTDKELEKAKKTGWI
jgi:hypothetical protein